MVLASNWDASWMMAWMMSANDDDSQQQRLRGASQWRLSTTCSDDASVHMN